MSLRSNLRRSDDAAHFTDSTFGNACCNLAWFTETHLRFSRDIGSHQPNSPPFGEGTKRTAARWGDDRFAVNCARTVTDSSWPKDRGREWRSPSPPSEPAVQFSRDGLSSQLFPHR